MYTLLSETQELAVRADFRHSRRTGIEVSMLLHESNHGTRNGKNGPVHWRRQSLRRLSTL